MVLICGQIYSIFLFVHFSGNPSCSPPNVSLPLSTDVAQATKTKKSQDFVFFVKIAINCRRSNPVIMTYNMELYTIDLRTGFFRYVATTIGTTVGNVKTTIRGQVLNYGHYFFKFTGNIEAQPGTAVNRYGYIEVTSTTLVANITGTSQASQGLNKTLTLDGSQSHDPDVGEGVYTGIDFTWLCKRDNEKFPDDTTSLPVVLPQSGSTGFAAGQDLGGCYGTGVGKLKPRDRFPYIVDLDVDKMKGDEDYVIKLAMKKRGETVYAVHRLRIKEEIHLNIV